MRSCCPRGTAPSAGGNRRTKADPAAELETLYTYDVDDPELYASNDHRLLKYETFDTSQQPPELVETVWYTYAVQEGYTGDVRQIIRHRPGEAEGDLYHRTWFNFDGAGRIWMVVSDTFRWDGDPENLPTNHVKLAAREFRYHSGRARYLMRDRDPDTLAPLCARSEPRPSGSGQFANETAVTIERGPLPDGRGSEKATRAMTTEPVGQPAEPASFSEQGLYGQ